MARSAPPAGKVHCLKVILQGTDPPVWRRLLVRSNTTLADVHQILQWAMGWENSHLHQFHFGNTTYGPSSFADFGPRPKDEGRARLATVAPLGTQFMYEYDFGDGWEHIVEVEKVLPAGDGEHYPRCVGGERACPPEDCGGSWGYAEMLDTINSGPSDERDELLDWLGDTFDPDHFDADALNSMLRPVGAR